MKGYTFKLGLVVALTLHSIAQAQVCAPLAEFDKIADTVTKNFFDKQFRGVDWPSRVAFYRKQIGCNMNESSVAETSNQLLNELNVSHTGVFTRQNLDYWALKSIFSRNLTKFPIAFSGIWARKAKNGWIARDVLKGSPAYNAGVRSGDQLVSLNGDAFSPLGWIHGKPSVLRFSQDGVSFKDVPIMPIWQSVQRAFLDASTSSEEIIEVQGKKIGYFHLWCGTHEKFLDALSAALRRFAKVRVDGLIVDLRDGFGGANLDYLKELQNNPDLTSVKKVFLINEGVRSGKEWVAAVFKKERIGTLVGTTTAGAFLGGSLFTLFGGKYLLYLAVAEFVPDDIGPIEGIGISPDVYVNGCQEYCQGSDPQVEKAVELLSQP